ncbi:hypothetical protein PoB_005220000 [Plakobranchus ocellatus]|uniref:Uncharacterized protein n=1 Tax=Plakobranchus ocellatus TaxID=259542 RepID=A0AAV4C2R4_9GAST|nr:hypothetical protein PoB_005220000 [Plakobranchus ocellatus]
MACRSNTRNIFAAILGVSLCCLQRMSFRDMEAHPEGSDISQFMVLGQYMRNRLISFTAQTTQNSGRLTVSRSIQEEERVHRFCTTNLQCNTLVQTPQITMFLEGFIERG